jgi:Ion transport protein
MKEEYDLTRFDFQEHYHERTPLSQTPQETSVSTPSSLATNWIKNLVPGFRNVWLPQINPEDFHLSLRRQIFLILTEPESSIASSVVFIFLLFTISLSNAIMILQTTKQWQFIPIVCADCYESAQNLTARNIDSLQEVEIDCVCPPSPIRWTVNIQDVLITIFAIEWLVRILCFTIPHHEDAVNEPLILYQCPWLSYLIRSSTILDFISIFPYYFERCEEANGLLGLRLLRWFRIFQLVRLGKYNQTFTVLKNTILNSLPYLRLLLVLLIFGSLFFGSLIYWLEKGEWEFWEETKNYQYIRYSSDGVTREISPFTDIPQSFWWFMVTATTVGYGDVYPTSGMGKAIAVLAMLISILVIAFPVSVFTDSWRKESRKMDESCSSSVDPTDLDYNVNGDDSIQFSKNDLLLLRECLERIEENQNRMKTILKKYS